MIPVNKPIISKEDANLIFKTAKSGWVSSAGPEIKIFENKFKNFIGKNIPLLSQWDCSIRDCFKMLGSKKK